MLELPEDLVALEHELTPSVLIHSQGKWIAQITLSECTLHATLHRGLCMLTVMASLLSTIDGRSGADLLQCCLAP